jgi:hypothetical protein
MSGQHLFWISERFMALVRIPQVIHPLHLAKGERGPALCAIDIDNRHRSENRSPH